MASLHERLGALLDELEDEEEGSAAGAVHSPALLRDVTARICELDAAQPGSLSDWRRKRRWRRDDQRLRRRLAQRGTYEAPDPVRTNIWDDESTPRGEAVNWLRGLVMVLMLLMFPITLLKKDVVFPSLASNLLKGISGALAAIGGPLLVIAGWGGLGSVASTRLVPRQAV